MARGGVDARAGSRLQAAVASATSWSFYGSWLPGSRMGMALERRMTTVSAQQIKPASGSRL